MAIILDLRFALQGYDAETSATPALIRAIPIHAVTGTRSNLNPPVRASDDVLSASVTASPLSEQEVCHPAAANVALSLLAAGPEDVLVRTSRLLQHPALCGQCAFDVGEPPLEFRVGAAQRDVGIGADVTREVDYRKQ